MSKTRIALIQTRTPAVQADALAHAAPLIEEAAAGGARFILTPEGSNFLQRARKPFEATVLAEADDPFILGMRVLARSHDVHVLIGSALVRRADGCCANRGMLIGPDGATLASYDKIHMFDVDLPSGETYRESSLYAPGDKAVTADTPFGRMGLTVCYDLRFPGLYRTLAKSGADVLTVPSGFTRPTGEAHWEVLLRTRAIENGAFVLAPAQGGVHEDGRETWGRSMAVGPWGEVLGVLDHDEPGVLFAEIDLEAVARARAAIPSLRNEREFSAP
jgi:predicted amidohydrolase